MLATPSHLLLVIKRERALQNKKDVSVIEFLLNFEVGLHYFTV